MMPCPRCGQPLSPAARFCAGCGAAAAAVVAPVLYVVPPGAAALEGAVRAACADHPHEVLTASRVDAVQEHLATRTAAGRPPSAVCLVGPSSVLPHAGFVDDTEMDDTIWTDNDYGCLAPVADDARHIDGLPAVPVTRIPTADAGLARRLLAVRDALPAHWQRGVAVSAQVWERASVGVLARIAPGGEVALQSSPTLEDERLRGELGPSVGRLYFNVHGSDQDAAWVGDGAGQYPTVLRPRSIQVGPNAILVSEACYGARHDAADTIALRFLAAGGSAFVGSTVIAWGPAAPPNALADLIPIGVYEALDRGLPLGAALLDARRVILADARARDAITPQVVNTLSSFVAYGSPLARVAGRALAGAPGLAVPAGAKGAARGGAQGLSGHEGGGLLARVRSGARAGEGPLGDARQRLASHERRLGWRRILQEDLPPAALAARFRSAADIQAELHALLGGAAVGPLTFAQYPAAGGQHSLIYAKGPPAAVRRVAVVVVGPGGIITGRYVARGGQGPS
jgi:hypothetical protein